METRFKELVEQLNELELSGQFPESWKPEEGDLLAGWVLRYTDGISKKSGPARICTIGTDDDRLISVWISPTVLKGEFERQNPQLGERIRIRYLGIPAGKEYRKYVVLVDRSGEAYQSYSGTPAAADYPRQETETLPYATATVSGMGNDPFADE